MNQILKNYFGEIYEKHSSIIELPPYQMIAYLQKQFNHNENDTSFSDKDDVQNKFELLVSENNEFNLGLENKDLEAIRDGIADQYA